MVSFHFPFYKICVRKQCGIKYVIILENSDTGGWNTCLLIFFAQPEFICDRLTHLRLIWAPKLKKDRKRKPKILNENKKLPSVTLASKLNIESEHINAVNRTKNYHGALIVRF